LLGFLNSPAPLLAFSCREALKSRASSVSFSLSFVVVIFLLFPLCGKQKVNKCFALPRAARELPSRAAPENSARGALFYRASCLLPSALPLHHEPLSLCFCHRVHANELALREIVPFAHLAPRSVVRERRTSAEQGFRVRWACAGAELC